MTLNSYWLHPQRRFLITKENKDKSLWWVPISYTTDLHQEFNETKPQFWLKNKQEGTFSIESNEWWLLNLQQTGKMCNEI